MDTIELKTISLIKEVVKYKVSGGNKWFDEVMRSFGAYYIFNIVCKSDSRLIQVLSTMSGKSYSVFNKDIREKAIVAEQIISSVEERPCPIESFTEFKNNLFITLCEETPILYNKYETMLNKHTSLKSTSID